MVRPVCLIVLVFLLANVLGAQDKILASGHPNYPPFMWKDGDRMRGICFEIAKTVFDQAGVPYTMIYGGPWADVVSKCKEGKIDVVVGAYRNKARVKDLEFSQAYLTEPVAIITKKGKSFPFRKWNHLIGKQGVTNVGESYGEEADKFIRGKLTVKEHPMEECFKLLLEGKADYMIIGQLSGAIEVERMGLAEKVEFLHTPFTTQKIFLAMSKKSPFIERMPKINSAIAALQRIGRVEKLMKAEMDVFKEHIKKRQELDKAAAEEKNKKKADK